MVRTQTICESLINTVPSGQWVVAYWKWNMLMQLMNDPVYILIMSLHRCQSPTNPAFWFLSLEAGRRHLQQSPWMWYYSTRWKERGTTPIALWKLQAFFSMGKMTVTMCKLISPLEVLSELCLVQQGIYGSPSLAFILAPLFLFLSLSCHLSISLHLSHLSPSFIYPSLSSEMYTLYRMCICHVIH